jgi:hypothetical protein
LFYADEGKKMISGLLVIDDTNFYDVDQCIIEMYERLLILGAIDEQADLPQVILDGLYRVVDVLFGHLRWKMIEVRCVLFDQQLLSWQLRELLSLK